MKKFIKKNYLYLLSFVISLTIISIIYILNDVSPFGSKSLLTIDFFHQYGPMLGEYYDRIRNGSNLIYSFNIGLGLPIFRNFLNYMSSPFNLIILLFKRTHLLTAYSIVIALRCAASSTTMTYYLSKKFKSNSLVILPISILYAFQAYFTAYYWNIMWLDGLVFLPLIVLGIENIINNNKWKLYTISLSIMLLSNYFIGFMICVYSCLYFLIYLIYKSKISIKTMKKDCLSILKKGFTFAKSSLLAGGIAAFMLLPLATSITSISATHDDIPTFNYYDFKTEDFLKGHLTGINVTVFASDTITNPNISCGILTVSLLLLFIINYKIPLKKKLCYLSLLLMIAACFFIPQLDFIMHAFHVPNDLPYRYSFLYSFTLLIICAYSLKELKELNYIYSLLTYLIVMILLLIMVFTNWPDITTNLLYVNMILITLYFIFYSYVYFYKNMKFWFSILFIVVASIDAIVSVNTNWSITHDLNSFFYEYEETNNTINKIKNNDNDKFYRLEKISFLTYNDPAWYNYRGINTFSSMAYENMAKLQGYLGMPGNKINSYYFEHQTPVYDMMFNLKYIIGYKNDQNRYETIDDNVNLFKYNIGLAYAVNKDIKDWNYNNPNPFYVQNNFLSYATNIYNVLSPNKLLEEETIYTDDYHKVIEYSYENPMDNIYFYTNSGFIDFIIIGNNLFYINDSYADYIDKTNLYYENTFSYQEQRILNISSFDENIKIIIGYNSYFKDLFKVYKINEKLLSKVYDKLEQNKLEITSYKENNIKGNIKVSSDMTLYTSIPYDEGWIAYVDGKKVKTNALANSLLTIDLKKGTHTINFKYEIPKFKTGLVISIISIIYMITSVIYQNKKDSKK